MKDRLKRWLLPLLVVLAVMVPSMASASNAILDVSTLNGHSTSQSTMDSRINTALGNGAKYFYFWVESGGIWMAYDNSELTYNAGAQSLTTADGSDFTYVKGSGITGKYNSGGYFFSGNQSQMTAKKPMAEPITAVKVATMEELKERLTQHGLTVFGVALAILTLMLAVLSVPRLMRYLAR